MWSIWIAVIKNTISWYSYRYDGNAMNAKTVFLLKQDPDTPMDDSTIQPQILTVMGPGSRANSVCHFSWSLCPKGGEDPGVGCCGERWDWRLGWKIQLFRPSNQSIKLCRLVLILLVSMIVPINGNKSHIHKKFCRLVKCGHEFLRLKSQNNGFVDAPSRYATHNNFSGFLLRYKYFFSELEE